MGHRSPVRPAVFHAAEDCIRSANSKRADGEELARECRVPETAVDSMAPISGRPPSSWQLRRGHGHQHAPAPRERPRRVRIEGWFKGECRSRSGTGWGHHVGPGHTEPSHRRIDNRESIPVGSGFVGDLDFPEEASFRAGARFRCGADFRARRSSGGARFRMKPTFGGSHLRRGPGRCGIHVQAPPQTPRPLSPEP